MADEVMTNNPEQNAVMEMGIVVDDGAIRVPIRNTIGEEIGVFYFRPTDIGIINRFNNAMDKFDNVIEPLEKVGIAPDGTAEEGSTPDEIEALHEAEERLYALCDYIFGGNMAEAFFGSMHPFSPVGGEFYAARAIDAVGVFISKQFDSEVKKMDKKIQKYTQGYKKGQRRGSKTK